MKHWRIGILALAAALCCGFAFCGNAAAAGAPEEVRVPITLEVPHAIAGAEFEIEYTKGLKFIAYEKSEAVQSAFATPVVEKNGKTYFGFYNKSNDYVPINGVLDVGHLIFMYSGEPEQSITVTEAKYVEVIDKDTTNSELLKINKVILFPLSPEAALRIGKTSYTLWIILGGAIVIIAAAATVFFLYSKKKALDSIPATDSNVVPEAISNNMTGTNSNDVPVTVNNDVPEMTGKT